MFCPKCRAEYRLGFTRCSECNVDLVSSLPDGEKNGATHEGGEELILGEFEGVYYVEKDSELIVLQPFLESTDIPFYFSSQLIKKRGWPASAPATLMVEKSRAEEVRQLLKELGKQ